MRKNVEDVNLGRDHGKAPDRGEPSGHTPDDAMLHHRKAGDLPSDKGGHKDHAPIEKGRPADTNRGGA